MIYTKNLNQAAMLVMLGGELVKLYDTSPSCGFAIDVKPWQVWYEKHIGIVPYRWFCKSRVELKEKAYRHSGKNPDFAGKKDGFLFNDVVRIIPFSERERKRLGL